MADVFVSYAREDRALAERFVAVLEAQGWSVWWDRVLDPGTSFRKEIDRALAEARTVVVLWTRHSVESDWVNAEANDALERRILIPVRLDDVQPSVVFRQTQSCDLRGWPDRADESEFAGLLAAIGAAIDRPVVDPEAAKHPQTRRRPLGYIAAAATLLALTAFLALWLPSTRESTDAPIALEEIPTPPPFDEPDTILVRPFEGVAADLTPEIVGELARLPELHASTDGAIEADFELRGVQRGDLLTVSIFDTAAQRTASSFSTNLARDGLREATRTIVAQVSRHFGADAALPAVDVPDDVYLSYLALRAALRQSVTNEQRQELLTELAATLDRVPRFAEAAAALCEGEVSRYLRTVASEAFEAAERHCARATRIDPENPWVLVAQGAMYRTAGQLDAASDSFERAIEAAPLMASAVAGQAKVLAARGNTTDAEALLTRARELDPENWHIASTTGFLAFRRGDFSGAAAAYEDAVQFSGGSAGTLNDLGSAQFMLGRYAAAVDAWRRSAAMAPSADAFTNLGSAHYYRGEMRAALTAYERAVALAPDDYRMRLNAGEAAYHLDGVDADPFFASAAELAMRAWRINPDAIEVVSALALANASLGRTEVATTHVDRVLAASSSDIYALYDVAVAFVRLGEAERASELVEQLVTAGYPRSLIELDANFSSLDGG